MKRICFLILCSLFLLSCCQAYSDKECIEGEYYWANKDKIPKMSEQSAQDHSMLFLLLSNLGKGIVRTNDKDMTLIVSKDKMIMFNDDNKDKEEVLTYTLGKSNDDCQTLSVKFDDEFTDEMCYSSGQISWRGMIFKKKK